MDSSRLRSRATQEEERAGHGGSHRTGPDERDQNITKKKKKEKNTLFNVHIPRKIYKDPELERP